MAGAIIANSLTENPPCRDHAVPAAQSTATVPLDPLSSMSAVSESNALRGPPNVARSSKERTLSTGGVFRSSNWMISVSSVIPEDKDTAMEDNTADTADRFVVIVSEPDYETTLIRSRVDFCRLHATLSATGTTPPPLPLNIAARQKSTGAIHEPQSANHTTSPSKEPKKKPSFFLAKVRSIFKDSEHSKVVNEPPRPVPQQAVSQADSPIPPPQSPLDDPSAKLGLFEFERPKDAAQTGSRPVGTRQVLNSTPAISIVGNTAEHNSQRISQMSETNLPIARPPVLLEKTGGKGIPNQDAPRRADLAPSGSVEPLRLGSSRHGASDTSHPAIIPPLTKYCPETIVSRSNHTNLLASQPLPLDELEFGRLDVALADYLIALCNEPNPAQRDILRTFFDLRQAEVAGHTSDPKLGDNHPDSAEGAPHNSTIDQENPSLDIAALAKDARHDRIARQGASQQTTTNQSNGLSRSPESIIITGGDAVAHEPRGLELCSGSDVPNHSAIRRTQSEEGKGGGYVSGDLKSLQALGALEPVASDSSRLKGGSVTTSSHARSSQHFSELSSKPITCKITIDDFDLLRTLGKGCAGKVVLVRHKQTGKVFAMKAMVKKQVIAQSELQHTLTEQAVLKRMSSENEDSRNPFVVKLWFSFHDQYNLYLVLDFHPGGDLATQLSRWGRLGKDRARFYTSEIVEGVEGLHAAGVIYRDLKPENVLLAQDGHVVLVDFGLAADFYPNHKSPARVLPHWMTLDSAHTLNSSRPAVHRHVTDTVIAKENDYARSFVGTAEYLAPEVIRGLPYSYGVDWWSLGTMVYEMIVGNTPFWAGNHADMYMNVLHKELLFPEDHAFDRDTRSFIRGLLSKDPELRLMEPRIKKHPYLSIVDFDHVRHRRYIPPYIPPTDSTLEFDTSNFDKTFLTMDTNLKRESVLPNIHDDNNKEIREVDDSAFAIYDFMIDWPESQIPLDVSEPRVGQATSEDPCLTKQGEDEESLDSESDSASLSISSLDSENGVGISAMHDISEEGECEVSTKTTTAHVVARANTEHSYVKTASREITPATLHRIQTLASEPGIKSSSRHSRDVTRASLDHGGSENSIDDWTILDAKPEDQAPNGRTGNQTLSAKGVVDKYRLALRKRRGTAVRKQPSWRSPTSSIGFGKSGGNPNGNGNDNERHSPGFLTPLSPTLAEIKTRLKSRGRKRTSAARESASQGTDTPAQVPVNGSSASGLMHYSGGSTPAGYASSQSATSRGTSEGKSGQTDQTSQPR